MKNRKITSKLAHYYTDGVCKNIELSNLEDTTKPIKVRASFQNYWDGNKKQLLTTAQWTDEMEVDEMKLFAIQQILKLSETVQQSTADSFMASKIKDFGLELLESYNNEGLDEENNDDCLFINL